MIWSRSKAAKLPRGRQHPSAGGGEVEALGHGGEADTEIGQVLDGGF